MSQSICQFIFFRVKPSVKPEDPSNEEGYALMGVLRATKHQNGHQSSSWGRTVEDTNTIVWVVGKFCPAFSTSQVPYPIPQAPIYTIIYNPHYTLQPDIHTII